MLKVKVFFLLRINESLQSSLTRKRSSLKEAASPRGWRHCWPSCEFGQSQWDALMEKTIVQNCSWFPDADEVQTVTELGILFCNYWFRKSIIAKCYITYLNKKTPYLIIQDVGLYSTVFYSSLQKQIIILHPSIPFPDFHFCFDLFEVYNVLMFR